MHTILSLFCVIYREQIYIAPSGVQKERIQVTSLIQEMLFCLGHIVYCDEQQVLQSWFASLLCSCVTQPEDMFVCDVEERDISCPPAWKKLKKSQCTPLFMNAYTMRGGTLQCIHMHIPNNVLIRLVICVYLGSAQKKSVHVDNVSISSVKKN